MAARYPLAVLHGDPPKRAHAASCGAGEACVLFIAFESPVDAVPSDQRAK